MKCRYTFIFLMMILFLCSCATVPRVQERQAQIVLLEQELERWSNFRLTGMSDIQYLAFSHRGQFVMARAGNRIRFDILGSGLFGLGGALVSAYANEHELQYRLPGNTSISTRVLENEERAFFDILTGNLTERIFSQIDNIIETGKCVIEGFEITFTHLMQIKEISNPYQEIAVIFNYDRQDRLTEIRVSVPIIRNLVISVDKIEHDNIVVSALR